MNGLAFILIGVAFVAGYWFRGHLDAVRDVFDRLVGIGDEVTFTPLASVEELPVRRGPYDREHESDI